MSDGRDQSVAAFRSAAEYLANPAAPVWAKVLLTDPLESLTPDLSLLELQPLSVLPTDSATSASNPPNIDRLRRRAPDVTPRALMSAQSPLTPDDQTAREANLPIFPVGRREGRGDDPQVPTTRNAARTLDGLSASQGSARSDLQTSSLNPQSQQAVLTVSQLLDTSIAETGTELPRTSGASGAAPEIVDAWARRTSAEAINPETTATQRTMEVISTLLDSLLADAELPSVMRGADVSSLPSSVREAADQLALPYDSAARSSDVLSLPPLAALVRSAGNLPDVPQSAVGSPPFTQIEPLSLDAETLTDVVNQVLVEQARRYGVNFA